MFILRSIADCFKQLDVVFMLDGSGSLEDSFERSLKLTKRCVQGLNFAGGRTRVGVMTYSDSSTIGFNLNKYTDKASVLNAISFAQVSGFTNTQDALRVVRTQMFNSAGDRPGAQNFAIIMTDGLSNVQPDRTIPEAQLAHQSGITVMGVGIQDQDGLNYVEIEGISSNPSSTYSFFLTEDTEDAIETMANSILDILCQ